MNDAARRETNVRHKLLAACRGSAEAEVHIYLAGTAKADPCLGNCKSSNYFVVTYLQLFNDSIDHSIMAFILRCRCAAWQWRRG
jgi:hypothetical protein